MGASRGAAQAKSPVSADPVSVRRQLVALYGGVFLASAVACAIWNLAGLMPFVFKHAHQRQVAPLLHEQLAEIRRLAPPGTRFIWINRVPDQWFPKIWQRLLYPDPMFIIQGESALAKDFDELRHEYVVRHVFSSGSPPIDPGYAWHVRMTAPPGSLDELWFGELPGSVENGAPRTDPSGVRLP